MKQKTVQLLSFALILCMCLPLTAIGEGQPSVEELAAFFSTNNNEEPTEQDKIIEPLFGIWYNKDVMTGEAVLIIGKNNFTNDYTETYIVLSANINTSAYPMNKYQIRSYRYTLTADKFEPNTFYFKDENNMYRAVLNENELTVYLVDEFAGEPKVYQRLGS